MPKIPKAWIAVAYATRMQLFFKTISSYRIFNRAGNIFQEYSRKKDGHVPTYHANDLAEVTGSLSNMNAEISHAIGLISNRRREAAICELPVPGAR